MFKSTFILFLCTIASKALGFAREMVVAYKFGAGAISDAFVTTNSIPNVLFSALSVAIGINFIPVILEINTENHYKERNRFTSNVFNISLIVMLIGIVLMLVAPEVFLMVFATGLSNEAKKYAINMLYITAFSAIPIIWSQIAQAYLQIKQRFLSTGLVGIVSNSIIIIFAILSNTKTYWLLSAGTLIGNLVMLCVYAFEMNHTGYEHQVYFDIKDKHIHKLILLTCPLMLETLLSEINIVVDRNMASRLDSGTITALSYASSLTTMIYVMIANAIITTSFPRFSKYHAEGEVDTLKKEFIFYGNSLAMLIIPMGGLLVALSEPIVQILFMRGKFDSHAVEITSQSVRFYALGIFAIGMKAYVTRMFYALKDTKTPTRTAVFTLALNVLLNIILVIPLKHIGLALATTVANIVAYIILLQKVAKKINIDWKKSILFENLLLLCGAGIAGSVCYMIFHVCVSKLSVFFATCIAGIVYMTCYMIFLEFSQYYIWDSLKNKIKTIVMNRTK